MPGLPMPDLAVDWAPLAVTGGRLRLGSATYAPEGLVVPSRDAGPVTLGWDALRGEFERGAGWALLVEPVYPQAGLVAFVAEERRVSAAPLRRRGFAGASGFQAPPIFAATALAGYLRDEPAARPALGVPLRVSNLLRTLRRLDLGRPRGLPREPWMGDRYDVHYAVLRGLDDAWPRRYALRPVAGEPVPDVATVVAAAFARLRPGLRERVAEETIAERVRPYLAVEPWPFSMLLDAGIAAGRDT